MKLNCQEIGRSSKLLAKMMELEWVHMLVKLMESTWVRKWVLKLVVLRVFEILKDRQATEQES